MAQDFDHSIPPDLASLVSAPVSRRAILAGGAGIGAASLVGFNASATTSAHAAGTVRWGNWGYYIDLDEKTNKYPTL